MSDDDKLRKQIEELIIKWVPLMYISDWEIEIFFDERVDTATSKVDTAYRHIEIGFNLNKMLICDDVEEMVVHELAHTYTARVWALHDQYINGDKSMQWAVNELYEEATTLIGWALVKTHRESLEKKKSKK